MTETKKEPRTCPVCMRKTLVDHCRENHPTCTWHRCTNSDCDAQLDLARGRGHALLAPGKKERRRVTLGKETS
jgi:hypothetical protein